MKRIHVIVLALAALTLLAAAASLAADGQKLQFTGVNYTKFLWGNLHYDGSMYNFTTVPGEGAGDNGQATEFELLVFSKPSSKIEVNGRIKSRFNQNQWTNFGGFGGNPSLAGSTGGDGGEYDPRSNEYIKLRGLAATITPGYGWLTRATIGSNDFGMFDPLTIGKIRYIDRDNGKGLVFQGSLFAGRLGYDATRISLPRLWAGPEYVTGDYTAQDAGYGVQLKYSAHEKVNLGYIFSYISDVEIKTTDTDIDDGRDLLMRQRNQVHGLKLDSPVSDNVDLKLAGYYSKYYTNNELVGMNSGIGTYSAYPVGDLDDWTLMGDLGFEDIAGTGLALNFQYFNLGADYVSVMAARREADVLLTEGHEASWFYPQVDNGSWGGATVMGYGGFLGNAQQLATTNIDNEFVDFNEPLAESAIGWKGITVAPSWGTGNWDFGGEFSYIDYNTNWQMWGDDDFSWGSHPYPTAEPGSGMLSFRNAYNPFQEKTTYIGVIKAEYFLDVANGIDVHARFKYVDEEDLRIDDEEYLPYNTDGTVNNAETASHFYDQPGQTWKSFNDLADDDRQMDMYVYEIGAGYQLTDELHTDLTFQNYDVDLEDGNSAFQAWNAHTMSSGSHKKNNIVLTAKYIIGGAEFGGTWQFAFGEYAPDYGDGYAVEYRAGEPGFTGRWGRWNSLEKREFDHRRMKAYMKLVF